MIKLTVFVINLKTSVDRRKYMEELCFKQGLSPVFIDAVYGKLLSQEYIEQVYDIQASKGMLGRELNRGEIGCALSHKFIYEYMLKNDIEIGLVLEDDVCFEENLSEAINLIPSYPKDWELVLFGHYAYYMGHNEVQSPVSFWGRRQLNNTFSLNRLIDYGYGTHAYLINRRGAKRLLEEISPFYKPIDLYTGSEKYINLYALLPTPIKVNTAFESDIVEGNKSIQKNLKQLIMSFVKKIYLFIKSIKPIRDYHE